MGKKIILLCFIALSSLYSKANRPEINVSGPNTVAVGESFSIDYEIGTFDISNFQAPDFSGFRIINNHRSSSSSTSIINGKTTSKSSTTYTFILEATKEGTFTIEPAIVIVDGNVFKSNTKTIHVVKGTTNLNHNIQSQSNAYPAPSQPPIPVRDIPQNKINDDNLFVKAIASKTKVYEKEAILLTYKIYANVNVTGFQGKLPVLNGFLIQELEPEQQQSYETYNGRQYMTAIWKQYVIFPQSAGRYEIPSIACEATISIPDGYLDPFGFMQNYVTRRKKIQTTPLTIEVQTLPTPPESYSGGVGSFTVQSAINKRKLKAGDVVSLKLTVEGNGNLKLMDTPSVNFPESFETYDTKVEDKFDITSSGHSGKKVFEYLAVPREGGSFTIPAIKFTYFDTKDHNYKTLTTKSYIVNVESDGITNFSQTDIEEKEKDIKFIKTGETELRNDNYHHLYSWKWILAYLIIISSAIAIYVFMERKRKDSSMNPDERRRKANKIVQAQLQKARLLMMSDNKPKFFEELMNALYSFAQNKLDIDNESFNKDQIRKQFQQNNIDESTINEYLSIIEECEYHHYSPSLGQISLEDYYKRAETILNKLGKNLK